MENNEKFVAAYVDSAIGMIHQNVNAIIELKARIKLHDDLVQEKNQVISALNDTISSLSDEKKTGQSIVDTLYAEKEQIKIELHKKINDLLTENNDLKEKLKLVEEKYETIQQKSSHMNTYETQIKEMKREIISKNEELEKLKNPTKINITKTPNKKPATVDDF